MGLTSKRHKLMLLKVCQKEDSRVAKAFKKWRVRVVGSDEENWREHHEGECATDATSIPKRSLDTTP